MFYDPLADTTSVSSASVKSISSEFKVVTANKCPKCDQTTVPVRLLSNEQVMYCTGCRVSLAIPE